MRRFLFAMLFISVLLPQWVLANSITPPATVVTGQPSFTVATGLAAAGSSCATASDVMTARSNTFSTVAAGTAALLPNVPVGSEILVFNEGANPALICPRTGQSIENQPTTTGGVQLDAGTGAAFFIESATKWRVF